jgi:hypothetical protein
VASRRSSTQLSGGRLKCEATFNGFTRFNPTIFTFLASFDAIAIMSASFASTAAAALSGMHVFHWLER